MNGKKIFIITLILLLVFSAIGYVSMNGFNGMRAEQTADMPSAAPVPEDMSVVKQDEAPSATGMAAGAEKLITNVYYQLRTRQFDQDVTFFNQLGTRFGAKIESIDQGTNYYENSDRRYFNVMYRVPSVQLNAFMADLERDRIVSNKNFNQYDVTDSYDEVSARLAVLQASQKRYLELLAKAERVEDIIAVEQALTDITMQIDALTSQKDAYDKDIDFTRVGVYLTEVPAGESLDGSVSFWKQLQDTFVRALAVFWTGLRQFVLLLVMLWPFVLLIGAAVLIYKTVRRKKKTLE